MNAIRVFVISSCLWLAPSAAADERPLWEFGLGVATLDGPDYRGSQDRTTFVLPMPYIVYRGSFLKADGDSVRGLLHKSKRLELNVSVGGATPVRSDGSNARSGMPDLDPALEIGPSLNYTIGGGESRAWELQLRLPLRAILTSDFESVSHRGYVLNPNINLDIRNGLPGTWRFGAAAGPLFGSSDFHRYYYGVEPQYANADRPAFAADAGYSGMRFNAALTNRIGDLWLGGYVRYEYLDGARVTRSPLVDTDHALSAGFAIAYVFVKSKRMVDD